MSSAIHPNGLAWQAHIMQQQAQGHTSDLAKRRSRNPIDKNLPDGVEECIPDHEVALRYQALREVEKILDATATRKKLDSIEYSNCSHEKVDFEILRIWISNTVEDQAWQCNGLSMDAFDFAPNMEATYRVNIEGKLLDANDFSKSEESSGGSTRILGSQEKSASILEQAYGSLGRDREGLRFSHFLKSLSVDFDRSRFRDGAEQSVEWQRADFEPKIRNKGKQNPSLDFDQLSFKRNGDENTSIIVKLHMHSSPERYSLSPELAEVVDMAEATQQEAVSALWQYIKARGLQEDDERRNFRCDQPLKRIIGGAEVGYVPLLTEYVAQHLQPLPPIGLPYTIRVDNEYHKDPKPSVYDVAVLVAKDAHKHVISVNCVLYGKKLKAITDLDIQLARLVQTLTASKAKQTFFNSLSENPAMVIRDWLDSQKRDLEIITGEAYRMPGLGCEDEWRQGGRESIWATQNARESVNVLLSRHR